LAFDATSTTLPPALASAPFAAAPCDAEAARRERDAVVRRPPDLPLFELVRLELEPAVRVDEFPLVDLLVLELLLDELRLEVRVVCAIVLASLASVPAACFAPAVRLHYPLSWGFEPPTAFLKPNCRTACLKRRMRVTREHVLKD
jgi:hypothetical protein